MRQSIRILTYCQKYSLGMPIRKLCRMKTDFIKSQYQASIQLTISKILLAWTCLVQAQAFTGPSERTISGFAQGTSYFVKYSSDKVLLKSEIDSVLNIIDLSMSLYRDNSLIKTFNNAANSSVQM